MSTLTHAPEALGSAISRPRGVAPGSALGAYKRVAVAGVSLLTVLALLALEVVSAFNHYAMRVTSDTPTFLALIRDLAAHPLKPDSVFFHTADTRSIHASPYLQVLALIWKLVAPAGKLSDPTALGTFVGLVAIPVTLFVLAMVWCYTRTLAGPTAAFIAIPAVLLLFGPVHIIFPELSLNGFMSTGYFPTTLATGLTLAALMMLRNRSPVWTVASVVMVALTLTTDPLNGAMLCGLMVAYECAVAGRERSEAWRIPLIMTAAFLLAAAWPAASVFGAFSKSGLPVPALLVVAFAAPRCWLRVKPRPGGRVLSLGQHVLSLGSSARAERPLARFGAWAAAMIALWGLYTMGHWPTNEPVLRAYRLGFYWNYPPERWLLLLAPGAVALVGLLRLAQDHRPQPLVWFLACFSFAALGAAIQLLTGFQVPLYYRFILLCEIPVAVGAAVFLAGHRDRRAARLVGVMLVCIFAFKVVTLMTTSTNLTYFRAPMLTVWSLGQVIPPHSGRVAADPITSYYLPAATDDPVVTMSLGHSDSGAEQARATAGYTLLHDVAAGDGHQASRALLKLWSEDVRWVVVEKFTTLVPATIGGFNAHPYSSLLQPADLSDLDQYYARLSAVGRQVYDDGEYTVFALDHAKLYAATGSSPSIRPARRASIALALSSLERPHADTTLESARLYSLGVRRVALRLGALETTPQLVAYGRSLRGSDFVAIAANAKTSWRCEWLCASPRRLNTIDALGTVQHADPYYGTVVALSPPAVRSRPAVSHHEPVRSHRARARSHRRRDHASRPHRHVR